MRKMLTKMFCMAAVLAFLSGCGHSSYFEDSGKISDTEVKEKKTEDNSKEKKKIYVQVAGAVKKPGVYELEPDSRVFSVIDMAGGLKKNADDSDLNQALPLEDGQKIYVFKKGEKPESAEADDPPGGGGGTSDDSGKVNINTADAAALQTLSGIGEAKAQAIISYRESTGSFTKPEDIMNVDGIAEGTFNKIKDQIVV